MTSVGQNPVSADISTVAMFTNEARVMTYCPA